MKIDIPDELINSIDNYLNTDGDGPAKRVGALNAVAYIGERLVAAVAAARRMPPTEAKANLETARKAHRHAAHVYAGVKSGPHVEARRRAAAAQLERAGMAVTMALALARTEDD